MTYGLSATIVGLAAYAAVGLVMSGLTLLLWRLARREPDRLSAAARARGLFLLRVLPGGAALLVVFGLVLPAFHRFEPRGHEETMPISLLVLAAFGAVLLATGVARGWGAAAATRRLRRAWSVSASPLAIPGAPIPTSRLASDLPLVAIIGLLRPRLFVSDRVMDACTAREIEAVLAHEAGHQAARDNLKRMIMRCCADLLSLTATGPAIDRDWREAAEEAADDCASAADAARSVDLAGALVKVSRMVPPGVSVGLPASALYHGESIERRVRRLLDGGQRASARPVWLTTVQVSGGALFALACAGMLDSSVLLRVQLVVEFVVSSLP